MFFIQKDRKDFNDLVVERVLYLPLDEANKILKEMFPERGVSVFVDRGGSTVISVDDVQLRVKT